MMTTKRPEYSPLGLFLWGVAPALACGLAFALGSRWTQECSPDWNTTGPDWFTTDPCSWPYSFAFVLVVVLAYGPQGR